MKRCPVCESELSEPISSFCRYCAWDIENDPTLNTMLLPLPDNILAKYKQKLEIAKKNLNKPQKASVSPKDVENEMYLIRKKFAEVEGYIGGERKKNTETLTKTQEIANQQKETDNELHLLQKKFAEIENYIGSDRKKNTETLTKHQEITQRQKETDSELRLIQKRIAGVENHIEDLKKKNAENLTKRQDIDSELLLIQKKLVELETYVKSDIETLKTRFETAVEDQKKAENDWLETVHERFVRLETAAEDEKNKHEANERAKASDIENMKKGFADRFKEMENELGNLSILLKKFADFVTNIDYEKKEGKNYISNLGTEHLSKVHQDITDRQKEMENQLLSLMQRKFAEFENRIGTSEIGVLRKIQATALEHQKEMENKMLSLIQKKTAGFEPHIGIGMKEEEKKQLIVLGIEKSGKVHDMTQEVVEHQKEAKNELLSMVHGKFAEFENRIEIEKKKREEQELTIASEIGNLRKIQEMALEHQKEMENKLLNIIQEKFAKFESHIEAQKKRAEEEEEERQIEMENELEYYPELAKENTEEKTKDRGDSKRPEPENWSKKAEAASASDEKIYCYTKAIESNPKDIHAYFKRGELYDHQGEYDKAIADYSEVIRRDPKYALAYNNRGAAHYRQHNCDKAISDYSEAIEINPSSPLFYNNRGIVYYHQGDYDNAIADYSQAVKRDPKYARAYNNRGSAYYSKRKYSKAIADYSKAIGLDPEYAGAYHNRGNLYKKIGRISLANKDFDKVLSINQTYNL